MKEKILERNMAYPGKNVQPRGGYGGGSYGGRGGQITWRMGEEYREEGGGNMFNREGTQIGSRRDPNAMDIDRGRREDKMCYVCGK